jgi:hypothetical protein
MIDDHDVEQVIQCEQAGVGARVHRVVDAPVQQAGTDRDRRPAPGGGGGLPLADRVLLVAVCYRAKPT